MTNAVTFTDGRRLFHVWKGLNSHQMSAWSQEISSARLFLLLNFADILQPSFDLLCMRCELSVGPPRQSDKNTISAKTLLDICHLC